MLALIRVPLLVSFRRLLMPLLSMTPDAAPTCRSVSFDAV